MIVPSSLQLRARPTRSGAALRGPADFWQRGETNGCELSHLRCGTGLEAKRPPVGLFTENLAAALARAVEQPPV